MRSIFKPSALLIAISLCGCAMVGKGPPVVHPGPVTLQVQSGTLSGWDHTFGSDGNAYSYMYTGGDDNHGNIQVAHREGPVTIAVHLNADAKFAFGDIYFRDDPNHQLDRSITNAKEAVISDKNESAQTAYYKVIVDYTVASGSPVIIGCDPKIVNN